MLLERPLALINSTAPIRICDIGGWTDTWFAGHGRVFNMAVAPCAEVRVLVLPHRTGATRLVIHAEDFGERYEVHHAGPPWGPHPLLEAAIASMDIPSDLRLEVAIHCGAPPGAGTGTSAAVTVALIGALDALSPGALSPHEAAIAAWRVETEGLERQSGIQDQLASAYGGVNLIEMSAYPHATVTPVTLPDPTWWELERRLLLVYLGKSHDSSAIHEEVIRSLEESGPDSRALVELRRIAQDAFGALSAGDFEGLGRAMVGNTEAQKLLHPALVGTAASEVIEIAKTCGASGWKVNGAGGEGGSLTLLCDAAGPARHALTREIERASAAYRVVPLSLSREGLRVWRQDLA